VLALRSVIVAMGVLLLVGCAPIGVGTSPTSSPIAISTATQKTHWAAPSVSFAYPAGWSKAAWASVSSFTDLVAAVSNQHLRTPCFRSGNSSSCGQPLSQLQDGAVLVEWWQNGFPNWTLAKQQGNPITVDGLEAKLQEGSRNWGECSGLGADRWINVVIASPQASNYWQFVACMRGPGKRAETAAATAILASAHLSR
jgi:hypothetical protein